MSVTAEARAILTVALGAVALLAALVLIAPPAVHAQDTGWRITSFDVVMDVRDDGSVRVVEDIAVDFGGLRRRGIFRQIPVRYDLPGDATVPEGSVEDWWRELDVRDLEVTSPSGAPADVELTGPGREGRDLVIRIGDPDTTISGPQDYRLSYVVDGLLDPSEAGPDLYWNATGDRWSVPIQTATTVVRGQPIARVACWAGRYGSPDSCTSSNLDGQTVRFTSQQLDPGSGLTIAARFEPGAVDLQEPIVVRRPTILGSLFGAPLAIPLTGATLVLGLGGVGYLAYREGRDRIGRGTVTAAGRVDAARPEERRRGLFEPRPVPVEYRPPEGLRPGELGLLIDERVDPVDVSATIVDLAVRGYLTIEEIEDTSRWRKRDDWRLIRGRPPAAGDGHPVEDVAPGDESDREALNRYERRLLDALFAGRDEVRISDLTGEFASDYALVEKDLYIAAERQGWFARRPDHVRSRWLVAGFLLAAAGVALTVWLFSSTRIAGVGLAVAATGFVLAIAHRWMPRRTGKGSALLTRTLGFREFIETADADRLRFAEAEGRFEEYLPYAVVFGQTERWAEAFEQLGVGGAAVASGWYVGRGPFNGMYLASGLGDFANAAAVGLPTVPASAPGSGGSFGGGGFSGGGFGGGGGGSW